MTTANASSNESTDSRGRSGRWSGRRTVIVAALPLVAVVALTGFGCWFVDAQERASKTVRDDIERTLADAIDSGDLSVVEVRTALRQQSLPASGDVLDALPTLEGVTLESVEVGRGPDTIDLGYRGDRRATGWCFDATVGAPAGPGPADPVEVSRRRC